MGGAVSNLMPAPPDFEYMCIMGVHGDSLRVVYGTTREIDLVRHAIKEHWIIQSEVIKFGYSYEFKLKGNPFLPNTSLSVAVACRKMACGILKNLYNAGWEHVASSDLTRTSDHLTWFFRRNPNIASTPYKFICVGLSRGDSLHIINASTRIHEIIKSTIARVWPSGIQNIGYEDDTMVVKLCGNPWFGNGEESVYSRLIVQSIINDLHNQQCVLHTNTNLRNSADTLFFRHDPSIVPGELTGNFVLSLNQTDRIRFIGATADIVDACRQVIQSYWAGGIQQERNYAGSWEIKLKGNPWWANGAEAVSSRYLILRIFEMFLTRGWIISASIDMTRKLNDKSVLLFQRCNPMQVPVFCLSLNQTDLMRLINAPQEIIQVCKEIILSRWFQGIAGEEMYAGSHQFKLNGNPWACYYGNHDGTHARAMLCFMLQAFRSRNWKMLTSADVSAKYVHRDKGADYPIDVHSWYFIYDASISAPASAFASQLTAPPSYESVMKNS